MNQRNDEQRGSEYREPSSRSDEGSERGQGIDSSDVTVQVSGGKVLLEGTVPDRYMKHSIENICDAAPGVQDIENRVRVRRAESGESNSSGTRLVDVMRA